MDSEQIPSASIGKDFLYGVILPFKAVWFIKNHKQIFKFALLPFILNTIFYIIILFLAYKLSAYLTVDDLKWSFWGPIGGWLAKLVMWLAPYFRYVVFLFVVLIAYMTFNILGMIIASPINDILSEKVELIITGQTDKLDLSWKIGTKAFFYSLADMVVISVKQLFFSLVSLIFLLVPVVGFLPLFCVGAYYSARGFIDTAASRNYLREKQKAPFLLLRRWQILGFGFIMQLLFMIPFAGLFVLPIGVIAGTMVYCNTDWNKLLLTHNIKPPVGFIAPKLQMKSR